MRRTEVLRGLRPMKFEEIYGRWHRHRLSQTEAAEILGMSERTFRRWRERYDAAAWLALPPTGHHSTMTPRWLPDAAGQPAPVLPTPVNLACYRQTG